MVISELNSYHFESLITEGKKAYEATCELQGYSFRFC